MQDRSGSVTTEILSQAQGISEGVPMPELILVAAWYLWWQRRQHVKGEEIQTAEKTAISIRVLATNFTRAYSSKYSERKQDQMWKRPANDVVKVNVDAAFQADSLSGATGAVARDHRGNFIAAATWYLPQVLSVDAAETVAIRNGLYLAGRIGCNKVQVESDSSFVVESVQNQDYTGSNTATILECRELALDFANAEYSHCFREANEAAHILASHSFSNRSSSFWEANIPDFISQAIVNDMSLM
nr:uncharacterized protein LOC109762044 [Aegilops tauschii subsp. strangulata]